MSDVLYSEVKFNQKRYKAKHEDHAEIKIERDDQNQSSNAGNTTSQQQESKVIPGGRDPVRVALLVLCGLLMAAVITLLVLYTTIKSEYLQAKHLSNTSTDCKKLLQSGPDWKYFGGKCYYFSSDMKNWHDSRDACISSGGHLVIIESEEEQVFLTKELGDQMKSGKLEDKFWIGLTDQKTEGTWLWVDNSALYKSFWLGEEPDDWKGNNNEQTAGEDCVRMGEFKPITNCWYDTVCSLPQRRICESR